MTIRRIGSGPGLPTLLGDIGNYADFNAWWRRQFPTPESAPARLTYQAGALPFGAKIELQVVAAAAEDA